MISTNYIYNEKSIWISSTYISSTIVQTELVLLIMTQSSRDIIV